MVFVVLVEWDQMAFQQILSPFACLYQLKFQPKKHQTHLVSINQKKSINNIASTCQSINHCNMIEINHVLVSIEKKNNDFINNLKNYVKIVNGSSQCMDIHY
jgi:hypothetical protein